MNRLVVSPCFKLTPRLSRVLALIASLTVATAITSGCGFYFDDDDDCDFGGDIPTNRDPVPGQINPETGTCEFFGGGGGGGCDDQCGPCFEPDTADLEAAVSWAFCEDQCTGLAESDCTETDACRAIYNQSLGYEACWGTDQTGPIRGGDCESFGAFECSQHDDCFAIHQSPCNADEAGAEAPSCELGAFIQCGSESPSCYGDVFCDALPPECPAGTMPAISNGCWTGACVPVEECGDTAKACPDITQEATCIAASGCEAQYRGIDCVCDADGCVCADHEFESCDYLPTNL